MALLRVWKSLNALIEPSSTSWWQAYTAKNVRRCSDNGKAGTSNLTECEKEKIVSCCVSVLPVCASVVVFNCLSAFGWCVSVWVCVGVGECVGE